MEESNNKENKIWKIIIRVFKKIASVTNIIFFLFILFLIFCIVSETLRDKEEYEVLEVEENVVDFRNMDFGAEYAHYGNLLTEDEKQIYLEIYEVAKLNDSYTKKKVLYNEHFERAFYAVVFDHPELLISDKYCIFGKNTAIINNGNEKKQQELSSVINKIILNTTEMTDYEKEIYIHDYLLTNVSYVSEIPCELNWLQKIINRFKTNKDYDNAYGALINNKANCRGFSAAFQLLLQEAGVEAGQVIGEVGTEALIGHSWNFVILEDEMYYTDVSWDRIGNEASEDYHYSFFNTTLSFMDKTHNRTKQLKYLADTDENTGKYSFYKQNGLYAENYDEACAIIISKLPLAIASSKTSFAIQIEDNSDFELMTTDIQKVVKKMIQSNGLPIEKCNFVTIKNGNTIIIKDFQLQKGALQ